LNELAVQEYDVGIAELYDPCVAAFMHKIGVRTTLAASAVPLVQMIARRFGIPGFASFMPNLFGSSMSSNYNIEIYALSHHFYLHKICKSPNPVQWKHPFGHAF
jgi:hypothetical protein